MTDPSDSTDEFDSQLATLEEAKKAMAAAEAVARANNWNVAIAILDAGANLILFQKIDDTQLGSVNIAIGKAKTAVNFKRPTKAFQDIVAAGGEGLRILALQGAVPVEGGVPIVSEGKLIGAVGASGGTSAQDGQCANAGAAAIK